MRIAAGIMFITKDTGQTLILKRGPGGDHPGEWCFPGGTLEDGETIEDCAIRETHEEVGDIDFGKPVPWTRRIADGTDFTTFVASVDTAFLPKLNGEHVAFAWVKPADLIASDAMPPAVPMPVTLGLAATTVDPAMQPGTEAATLPVRPDDATWNEGDHPRDEDGKFTAGAGSGKSPASGEPGGGSVAGGPEPATGEPAGRQPAGGTSGASSGGAASKNPARELLKRNQGDRPVAKTHAEMVARGDAIAAKVGAKEAVDKARKRIEDAKGYTTDQPVEAGGFVQADGSYTAERRAIHDKLIAEIFTPEAVARARPAAGEKPVMVMLGGRGGSGKSWLTGKDGPVDSSKFVLVDADHFKTQLPGYEGWNAYAYHEESSHLVDRAAEIAQALGLNVIHDATLKSTKGVSQRVADYQNKGFDVHGYFMHTTPETATERAMQRFKRGGEKGRFVPPEIIMSNTDNEANFDSQIPNFAKWGIWDNNGDAPKAIASGNRA